MPGGLGSQEISLDLVVEGNSFVSFIYLFIYLFISFRNLSDDRSVASSTECELVCPLNFQYPIVSLRSSSSCLHIFPRLSVTSVFPSVFQKGI